MLCAFIVFLLLQQSNATFVLQNVDFEYLNFAMSNVTLYDVTGKGTFYDILSITPPWHTTVPGNNVVIPVNGLCTEVTLKVSGFIVSQKNSAISYRGCPIIQGGNCAQTYINIQSYNSYPLYTERKVTFFDCSYNGMCKYEITLIFAVWANGQPCSQGCTCPNGSTQFPINLNYNITQLYTSPSGAVSFSPGLCKNIGGNGPYCNSGVINPSNGAYCSSSNGAAPGSALTTLDCTLWPPPKSPPPSPPINCEYYLSYCLSPPPPGIKS